ncbi:MULTISPECIES: hypothetical protein [unclassified Caballeronia]|uniref:hypothetical protein n=1 Tax=unclassified Caballeronia TaxID=2646786 RepID=UPI003ECDBF19
MLELVESGGHIWSSARYAVVKDAECPRVKGLCETAGAGAAPKLLASGSPKIAILFLPRHLAQRTPWFAVVLLAFGR